MRWGWRILRPPPPNSYPVGGGGGQAVVQQLLADLGQLVAVGKAHADKVHDLQGEAKKKARFASIPPEDALPTSSTPPQPPLWT